MKKKSAPVKKAAPKKAAKPAPKAKKSAQKPTSEAKQNKALLKAYPALTQDDLNPYQGEERESVLRRISEKIKVSYEDLVKAQG